MSRGWRAPSLAGREEELDALRRRLGRAAAGQGQCVLVEGEAGIGKTRLVEELLAEAAARGFALRRGAAEELDVTPFAALAAALGRHGEVSALLTASLAVGHSAKIESVPGARYRVVEAIVGWVQDLAGAGPVTLAVEDLQWADPSTVVTLRSLMRRTRHLPVAVVGTLRPTPRDTQLTALLEAADDDAATMHLALGPLGDEAVESLVAELVGAAPGPSLATHLRRAGGNPFFVIELVEALVEEGALELCQGRAEDSGLQLAPGRRLTLLRRLRPLSPLTHEMLRMAAVLGPSFQLSQLAAVLGRSPVELATALDEAMAAGVVGDAEARLAFRHDLLRDAIYFDIAGPIRAGLHLYAGRTLAQAGAPVLQVAEHLALGAEAGDRQAVHWLHEAGRDMLSANPGTAAELIAKARELADADDPARSAMTADLVTALDWSGRYAQAEALARQALAAPAPCEPSVASVLRLSLLRALVADGRGVEALQEVMALEADFSTPAATQLQVEAAWARLLMGDAEGARATAEGARAGAEATSNGASTCGALVVLGYIALLAADVAQALTLLGEAVARAEVLGTAEALQVAPHVFLAGALLYANRVGDVKSQLLRGRALVEETGAVHALPMLQLMSVMVGFFAGDWDDSVAEAQAGFDLADDMANRQATVVIYSLLAIRAVHVDDFLAAAEALAHGEAELATGKVQFYAHWLGWARALYEEAQGRTAVALDALDGVWGMCAAAGMLCDQPLLGPDLVRLHLAMGQREQAGTVTQAVEATAARMATATARASALRCRGLVTDDPDVVVSAVILARTAQQPPALGAACMDAANLLSRAGRGSEAMALLEEALAVYHHLGAAREEARAACALRALGVRRRPRRADPTATDASHLLTKTEAAVAALVGQGLSNRQVAERLFVSPRTVESHLAHIFAKLGLSSRAQLMLWAASGEMTGSARPAPTAGPAGPANR